MRHAIMLPLAGVALFAACGGVTPTPMPRPSNGETGSTPAQPAPQPMLLNAAWPVETREHVDLWLHTYALLAPDSMGVPYFSRGYRDRMLALRRQRGVNTLLDQNRDKLVARVNLNPSLGTNGQFLPLYFPSWETMKQEIDQFVRGNTRPVDATQAQYFAVLAAAFPNTQDRDWLRQLAEAAEDENRRFYQDYWNTENRQHAAVITHVDSLWQRAWRPLLQRFLNNTQQQNGELYLSQVLGGEGRTVRYGKGENAIAVPEPATNAEAEVVLWVAAHELAANVANSAIADNTTPAEQRSGASSRYEQSGAVRAGAMLLERTVPAALPGYMRYYLLQAGRIAPPDARATFMGTFVIPDPVRDAIGRQLDVILGGI